MGVAAFRGRSPGAILPGLVLCGLIAAAAYVLQQLELAAFGRAWIEALVLTILVGGWRDVARCVHGR